MGLGIVLAAWGRRQDTEMTFLKPLWVREVFYQGPNIQTIESKKKRREWPEVHQKILSNGSALRKLYIKEL